MKLGSLLSVGGLILASGLGGVAMATEPPKQAPAPATRPVQPAKAAAEPGDEAAKPLDLRIGDVREYMTPEEFRALISLPDESNTVVVKADAPLVPMKSPLDVPGGIMAPFWALAHPTQAWRLFLPDARVDITKIPPPETMVPPPVFRWGP